MSLFMEAEGLICLIMFPKSHVLLLVGHFSIIFTRLNSYVKKSEVYHFDISVNPHVISESFVCVKDVNDKIARAVKHKDNRIIITATILAFLGFDTTICLA